LFKETYFLACSAIILAVEPIAPIEPSPPKPQLMHYPNSFDKVGSSNGSTSSELWYTSSVIPTVKFYFGV